MTTKTRDDATDFTIRAPHSVEEWKQTAMAWATKEEWNIGPHDADSFLRLDPSGFFLAEMTGKVVGCICAVKYGADHGFIGLYIVKQEHRGRGIGVALFSAAMRHLAGRRIALDAVEAQMGNYAKNGFFSTRWNRRHIVQYGSLKQAHKSDFDHFVIRDATIEDSRNIAALDKLSTKLSRPTDLFVSILNQPGARGLIAVSKNDNSNVLGVLITRHAVTGRRAGPWYATDPKAAFALMREELQKEAAGTQLCMDVVWDNPAAAEAVKELGMSEIVKFNRMWTGAGADIVENLDTLYAHCSVEWG